MKICAKYLHCTHEEFIKLSSTERRKWVLFEQMERERKNYFDKLEADKIKNKTNTLNNKYNMRKG